MRSRPVRTRLRKTPCLVEPHLDWLEPRLLLDGLTPSPQFLNGSAALLVPNQGQWSNGLWTIVNGNWVQNPVRFGLDGGRRVAVFDDGTVSFEVQSYGGPSYRTFSQPNAHTTSPAGQDQAGTRFNYLLGNQANWHTDVPSYGQVLYGNIYDGVDMSVSGKPTGLLEDFTIQPGADISQIQFTCDCSSMSVDSSGVLTVGLGVDFTQAVRFYQDIGGQQTAVSGTFVNVNYDQSNKVGTYGFQVTGSYDTTRPLELSLETTWGGWSVGLATSEMAMDPTSNFYLTGSIETPDFDVHRSGAATNDTFIAKINANGTGLDYFTYLGGDQNDSGSGIAVDAQGHAYVTGYAASSGLATAGAYSTSPCGGAFVAKLNAGGNGLAFFTYLGGNSGRDIAIDAQGNSYIAGDITFAVAATPGAYQQTFGGGGLDAFAAEVSATGTGLVFFTYLGGTGSDSARKIALDNQGGVYLAGLTSSDGLATAGAFQTVNHGCNQPNYSDISGDVFLARLSSQGTKMSYFTYLGGDEFESVNDLVVNNGSAYVLGATSSAIIGTCSGNPSDGFVAKIRSDGGLDNLTRRHDYGGSMAVDSTGNLYMAGSSVVLDVSPGGQTSGFAFVGKIGPTGDFKFLTHIGQANDEGKGIALDASGNVIVCLTKSGVAKIAPESLMSVAFSRAKSQSNPAILPVIHFTVTFSEPVNDFNSSDVSFGGSAGPTQIAVTGSGTTYDVAISGMTSSGTVTASIPSGAAHDSLWGRPISNTAVSDNTITYQKDSFSADLDWMYFTDAAGRQLSYDFTNGTPTSSGMWPVPGSPPTAGHNENPDFFSLQTGGGEYTSLGNGAFTVGVGQPAADSESSGWLWMNYGGILSAYAGAWTLAARFKDFRQVTKADTPYEFSLRTFAYSPGRTDDAMYPKLSVTWFTGTYQGVTYNHAAVLEAAVEDTDGASKWSWGVPDGHGLILKGLDPLATAIDLKIDVNSDLQSVNYYYRLNSGQPDQNGSWTLLTSHTLASGVGKLYGLCAGPWPALELSASTNSGGQDSGVPDLNVTLGAPGPGTVVSGQTLTVPITITNAGDGAAAASNANPIKVDVRLSSSAVYNPSDSRVAQIYISSPIAAGGSYQTSVSFAIPSNTTPGTYYVTAYADSTDVLAESNETNNSGASSAFNVVWQFGALPGNTRPVPLTITGLNGDQITLSLKGPGSGVVYADPDGRLDIGRIVLSGTGQKSSLVVSTKGPAPEITVGDIDAGGCPIGSISAPTSVLEGALTIAAAGDPKAAVSLSFAEIHNASIVSAMPIKSLKTAQWIDDDSTKDVLQAPAAALISIAGRKANPRTGLAYLRGDFEADLDLGVAGSASQALGTLSVAGVLDGSTISSKGSNAVLSIGSVKAGYVRSASIIADGGVSSLNASQWEAGTIDAGWVGSITTKANAAMAGVGNFGASLILTGTTKPVTLGSVKIAGDLLSGTRWNVQSGTIGSILITGTVDQSLIRSAGDIGSIRMGASSVSDFAAGVDYGLFDSKRHVEPGDPAPSGTIKTLSVTGWKVPKGQALPRCLVDSNISAKVGKLIVTNWDGLGGLYTPDGGVLSIKHTDTLDPSNSWVWPAPPKQVSSGPENFLHII